METFKNEHRLQLRIIMGLLMANALWNLFSVHEPSIAANAIRKWLGASTPVSALLFTMFSRNIEDRPWIGRVLVMVAAAGLCMFVCAGT